MGEDRFVISDELWEQMWPLLPGKVGDPGAQVAATMVGSWRRFFGVCGQARLGAICPRISAIGISFSNGSADGPMPVCLRVFVNAINGEPDLEYAMIDGTIVQAHQKASGAKGGLNIKPSGALAVG